MRAHVHDREPLHLGEVGLVSVVVVSMPEGEPREVGRADAALLHQPAHDDEGALPAEGLVDEEGGAGGLGGGDHGAVTATST